MPRVFIPLFLTVLSGCEIAEDHACGQFCKDEGYNHGSSSYVEAPMDLYSSYRECACTGPGTGISQENCTQFCEDNGYPDDTAAEVNSAAPDSCLCHTGAGLGASQELLQRAPPT